MFHKRRKQHKQDNQYADRITMLISKLPSPVSLLTKETRKNDTRGSGLYGRLKNPAYFCLNLGIPRIK
jgi:hypothetical protein